MRRVVITGIGIVSSIGSNAEEVKKSLFDCTPGISKAIGYDNLGFKSQVYGSPNIDLEENIDRKKLRFLADGSAWAYIAAEQAINDAELEEGDVSNERQCALWLLQHYQHILVSRELIIRYHRHVQLQITVLGAPTSLLNGAVKI